MALKLKFRPIQRLNVFSQKVPKATRGSNWSRIEDDTELKHEASHTSPNHDCRTPDRHRQTAKLHSFTGPATRGATLWLQQAF